MWPMWGDEGRGGLGWGFLGGAIWRHALPPPTRPCVRKPRKHLASCLYQGIQPWLGAASIEGREDSWATSSDAVESTTRGVALPPALSVLSLTYFLASLSWVVCYLQEDGSKLMCCLSPYSFSGILLMMETVKS